MRRRLLHAATAAALIAGTIIADQPRAAAQPLPDHPTVWPPVLYQQTWATDLDVTDAAYHAATALQIAQDAYTAEQARITNAAQQAAQDARLARLEAIDAGSWHRLPDWLLAAVLDAADLWGTDPRKLARIVVCESGGNPTARNPSGASGLTQQLISYWPARAAAAGIAGASVWDPAANLTVAAMMLSRSDAPWSESRGCWR